MEFQLGKQGKTLKIGCEDGYLKSCNISGSDFVCLYIYTHTGDHTNLSSDYAVLTLGVPTC